MSILGLEPDKKGSKDDQKPITAVLKNDKKEISLGKAVLISTIAHPLFVLLLKGLFLLLLILGINLSLFDRPEPKVRDIEFVLVDNPEQAPINKKTKYRADRNTRAGGKHDKKRKVSEPKPAAAKSKPQPRKTPTQPKAKRPNAPKHTPVPPRPKTKATMPKPRIKPPNSFPVPVPMAKTPRTLMPKAGPSTSAPMGTTSPSKAPSPIMSSSSSFNNQRASGYSTGGGRPGNPGPGNPNGRPGIDALKEPDFGPYMRDLQRRIKRNWDPPKGNESKRVVLMFRVSRDGRLLDVKVQNSSSVVSADRAAIAAVELTAPFRPLPPEYKGNDIEIQFTFDYNVFGIGNTRY